MKIVTEYVYPPIPDRNFDWCAYDEDSYDGAPDAGRQIVGWGPTEQAALLNFNLEWQEAHDFCEHGVPPSVRCERCDKEQP